MRRVGTSRQSPIQPPWKMLPWENPAPPAKVVKLVVRRPDNLTKGSMYRLFFSNAERTLAV